MKQMFHLKKSVYANFAERNGLIESLFNAVFY